MTTSQTRSRPDGHQISVMRAMLKKWGAICEASRNWSGYASTDTTYRAAFGAGGGGEKRLPIPGIPSFAIQLSAAVLRLPDIQCNAVTIWYAHHWNAERVWLTPEDKAKILGIDVHSLRYHERQGRDQLIVDAPRIIDTWQTWQDELRELAELRKVS